MYTFVRPTIRPEPSVPRLRDPASALHAVHRRSPLRPGTVLLTLVADPDTGQRPLGFVRVWDSATGVPGHEDASVRIDQGVRLLTGRHRSSPGSARLIVVVVARTGRVVFRSSDLHWIAPFAARRASAAGPPELLLVTEHGFRCWSDSTAGRHPALRPARAGTIGRPGTAG